METLTSITFMKDSSKRNVNVHKAFTEYTSEYLNGLKGAAKHSIKAREELKEWHSVYGQNCNINLSEKLKSLAWDLYHLNPTNEISIKFENNAAIVFIS